MSGLIPWWVHNMMAQMGRSKGEVEPRWQQWATGDVVLEATAFLASSSAPSLPIIQQPLPHAPTRPKSAQAPEAKQPLAVSPLKLEPVEGFPPVKLFSWEFWWLQQQQQQNNTQTYFNFSHLLSSMKDTQFLPCWAFNMLFQWYKARINLFFWRGRSLIHWTN